VGLDTVVATETCYRLDSPGMIFRWERDFPHHSRHPEACIASYAMGTGSLLWGKVARAWHWPSTPHVTLRLKKEYTCTFTPSLVLHGLLWGWLSLPCTLHLLLLLLLLDVRVHHMPLVLVATGSYMSLLSWWLCLSEVVSTAICFFLVR
jgi:hypothetical protein